MRKDLKHIIKDIEKSQEDIVNYRTRKKKIKTSDIHKILYPKEKTLIPNTIFIPENPKSISINYVVAYEILPVHSSMTCKFCRTEKESINHLLLECNGLLNVIVYFSPFVFLSILLLQFTITMYFTITCIS